MSWMPNFKAPSVGTLIRWRDRKVSMVFKHFTVPWEPDEIYAGTYQVYPHYGDFGGDLYPGSVGNWEIIKVKR